MLTIHAVVDNATQEQLDMVLDYLVSTQQQEVNIAAGSQIDRGMQFVERVRYALPTITIFWRILEDTGIHAEMTVEQWWANRVAPYLAWMQKNRVVMVLDNESSGSDVQIMYYVEWEIDALRKLHKNNLRGAVARWATGNIGDGTEGSNQYPLLKPLFAELLPGDYVSPNEYTNTKGLSSGGNIGRYKLMEDVAGRELPISIGEAGILHKYEADNGWQDHMTEQEVVDALLANEPYYRNGRFNPVHRSLFCVGGYGKWRTLQLTQGILNLLKKHYAEVQPIVEKKIIITVKTANTRLRATPTTNGKIVVEYEVGDYLATQTGEELQSGNYTWLPVTIGSYSGYIAKQVIDVRDATTTPPSSDKVCVDKFVWDDAKSMLETLSHDLSEQAIDIQAVIAKMNEAK